MTENQPQPSAGDAGEDVPNRLNLNDLFKCVQWMNLGFERGAFKAEEIGEVTGVYQRVYGFCKTVEAQQQEAEAAQKKKNEEEAKKKDEEEAKKKDEGDGKS